MMPRALLADLDGVILGTAPALHYSAFSKALQQFGYPIIPAELHEAEYNGMGTKEKLRKWLPGSVSESEISDINKAKQVNTEELIKSSVGPEYEITFFFRWLRDNGWKLAVVTNCLRPTATLILDKMQLTSIFDSIVTASDVDEKKPHPQPYLKGASSLGLLPSQCLAVDDTPLGCKSAIQAGCLTWELSTPSQLRLSRLWKIIDQLQYTNYVKL